MPINRCFLKTLQDFKKLYKINKLESLYPHHPYFRDFQTKTILTYFLLGCGIGSG